jgi:hypothetical protein
VKRSRGADWRNRLGGGRPALVHRTVLGVQARNEVCCGPRLCGKGLRIGTNLGAMPIFAITERRSAQNRLLTAPEAL